MRRGLIPLVLLLVVALAGCGGQPSADPADSGSPTPSTSASASTAPSDGEVDLDSVTRILLGTEIVSFGDEIAWAVDGFAWTDPLDEVVAKLTTVFGVAPIVETQGTGDTATVRHDWSGFTLYSPGHGGGFGVEVATAEVGGITIEVGDGVRVGTPLADATALADTTGVVFEAFEARFDTIALSTTEDLFIAAYGAADGTGAVTTLIGPLSAAEL